MTTLSYPATIAIAGAWGYIGRKFLTAAQNLGLRILVHDPGPAPADSDLSGVTRLTNEAEFYDQPADLFHLALHPDQRQFGLNRLLASCREQPWLALCEKPMAAPDRPEECRRIVAAVKQAEAALLYDFPELFDPITARICEFLAGLRDVRIDDIAVQRSKDREDPGNPRNYKRMVPIEYQESVHCLAFVLYLLASVKGSVAAALEGGLSATARAEPYEPPNPQDYPAVVDGQCQYGLRLGPTTVTGRTDFKRGAEWAKRRTIRGTAAGLPFAIEADYLEGRKRLVINGQSHADVVATDSYAEVIKTCGAWHRSVAVERLMAGLYPNPAFAQATYQMSGVLWRSSRQAQPVELASLDALLAFDAGYPRQG